MKTSWKYVGVLVVCGFAFVATGCKSGSGGSVAQFENPFKSFASKPDDKGKSKTDQPQSGLAANPKPSTVSRPEVTAPIGGYGTPGSPSSLAVATPSPAPPSYQPQNPQPMSQPMTNGASGLYADSPYGTAPAAGQYAHSAAGTPVASAYEQTSYAVPRDPRMGEVVPAAQSPYGQYQPNQANCGAYSVPETYDGMYQTTAIPAGQPSPQPYAQPYTAAPAQPPYAAPVQPYAATPPAYNGTPEQTAYPGYAPTAAPAGPYNYR
ncbi:MAG: hypothetical protein ACRC46_13220 [Thermoguttaceae bacterium]